SAGHARVLPAAEDARRPRRLHRGENPLGARLRAQPLSGLDGPGWSLVGHLGLGPGSFVRPWSFVLGPTADPGPRTDQEPRTDQGPRTDQEPRPKDQGPTIDR